MFSCHCWKCSTQLQLPQPVSGSVSSGIWRRRWKVCGPVTVQNQSTLERISRTTVLWFEMTWSTLCIACHQRRAVSRRSWVCLGSVMWRLLTQQSVSTWCIPSWATWPECFISEGTGWKHLFQRHPLHLLLHITAFLSFLFLQQTGLKPNAQLNTSEAACLQAAPAHVWPKELVWFSRAWKKQAGQTSGGSAVHPDAPLRQLWMKIK